MTEERGRGKRAPREPGADRNHTGNRARLEPSKRDASRQAHPSVLGFTDRQSSRDSRGIAIYWPRIPPASCSNHGRDVARPLCRRDHRAPACGGSAMSPANGRLRSRAWAFQMGRSQMTESGSTATPPPKKKKGLCQSYVLGQLLRTGYVARRRPQSGPHDHKHAPT